VKAGGGKPLGVAIVCYPTFGGSGIVATELGRSLAERGHTVHFICYNQPARLRHLSGKVHFHLVDVVTYPLFRFPPYTLALATRIARTIREEDIDLVHVHYAIPHSIAAQLALQMTKRDDVKIITTLHGTDVQLVGLDPSYRDITRFSMEGCCGLTAVSRYLAEVTVREFDLTRPVEFIPNFVDPSRFRRRPGGALRKKLAPRGEKIVCHVSNFREVKRVVDVVRVFHRIRRRIPAVLVMIGDGPDRPTAEEAAHRLGIADAVRFLPFVPNIERYLSVADLFLLPSSMESFGLAALEAMSCEVPVVAYRVGGLPEVIGDGEGGSLVDLGDWIGMAREGARLLGDDGLARRTGAEGRARAVRLFSEEAVVSLYEAYYRRTLGQ
jgi:N-acetyl-alpha-D-glucosaminyl L-malate synthase BshA